MKLNKKQSEIKELINVQGKWYHLLLTSGAIAHLSKPLDVYNEVHSSVNIWRNQPFFYQHEVWYGSLLNKWYTIIRKMICFKHNFLLYLQS